MRNAFLPGLLALLLPTSVAAVEGYCDPELVRETRSPSTYQDRGDRCEGIYGRPVSGRHLLVRSLVETSANFDPLHSDMLHLAWNAPTGSEPVFVRAHCFKPRTYYRMDTHISGGKKTFLWPTGFLQHLRLSPSELGLVAWTEGSGKERLYLPLRLASGEEARSGIYEVAVIPGRDVREIRITVQRLGGEAVTPVVTDQPLDVAFYPVDQPVRFRLPALKEPGRYALRMVADRRNDDAPATRTIHFLHGSSR